jgi:hypothetical protein
MRPECRSTQPVDACGQKSRAALPFAVAIRIVMHDPPHGRACTSSNLHRWPSETFLGATLENEIAVREKQQPCTKAPRSLCDAQSDVRNV